MKKKIIDIIGMTIISIVIITLNLIVGANEKGLRTLPISIMLAFEVIYLIIKKVFFKQKIVIKNKIDIFVLLFMFSTLLPYIFKTYSTFQGTIEFILKYFFAYSTYLVVRNTVDSKKKANILIWVTLASSLIIAILGIDIQNKQYLTWILKKLNLQYTSTYVLVSTFGYSNTVAIYFSFCIFLAINQLQNTKNKIGKIPFILYLILAFYVVYKTLSRSVFVLLLGALFIYFILYYIENIKKNKRKLGKIVKASIIIIFLGLTFIFGIGIKVSKPYVFTHNKDQRILRYDFTKNQEYTIQVDLQVEDDSKQINEGVIEISILERNEYFNENVLISKKVNKSEKTHYLTFITTEDLYSIDILFENPYNKKVSIEKCYINGKEYPMNYKFLPYYIGDILRTYKIKDESIMQRFDFWEDCIKISKDSPIIGQGGNTWKKLSQAVQDYPYGMKESHSYLFELLISYGIVGVILYTTLMIFFITKIIRECITNKETRKYKMSIFIGVLLILLHSFFFDFDMSFLVIFTTVFAYIGILIYDSKEEFEEEKMVDYLILFFILIVLGVYIMANFARYAIDDKKLKKNVGFYIGEYQYKYLLDYLNKDIYFESKINEIQKFMLQEPYYYQQEAYSRYWNQLLNNLEKLEENEIKEYLSFINERYRKIKFMTPMYINSIQPRANTMKNAYVKLSSMNYTNKELLEEIEELRQIINDEYKVNIENIRAKERNGCSQEYIDNISKEYEKIMSEVNK